MRAEFQTIDLSKGEILEIILLLIEVHGKVCPRKEMSPKQMKSFCLRCLRVYVRQQNDLKYQLLKNGSLSASSM